MALSSWRNDFDNFFNTLDSELLGLVPVSRRYTQSRSPGMTMDLREGESEYVLSAELPGVDKKDIDVSIEKGVLTVSAVRSEAREGEKDRYHFSERSYGKVSRSIRLPDNIDEDSLEARHDNGILSLRIKKGAQNSKRHIVIQ